MAKGKFNMMPQNMNNMLKQAQKMQQDMLKAQQEIEEKEIEASSGGGAVTVKVSGKKELVSIKLSPEVVDPDDIEMLNWYRNTFMSAIIILALQVLKY